MPPSQTSRRSTAQERGRDEAADRADVDDPALARTQQRQERLGDRHLPDDADLQLLPPLVERHELDGTADADSRVVDEPVQPAAPPDRVPHGVTRTRDPVGVGDVDDHRHEASALGGLRERLAVLRLADPREHAPSLAIEAQRDRSADTARSSRDDGIHRAQPIVRRETGFCDDGNAGKDPSACAERSGAPGRDHFPRDRRGNGKVGTS